MFFLVWFQLYLFICTFCYSSDQIKRLSEVRSISDYNLFYGYMYFIDLSKTLIYPLHFITICPPIQYIKKVMIKFWHHNGKSDATKVKWWLYDVNSWKWSTKLLVLPIPNIKIRSILLSYTTMLLILMYVSLISIWQRHLRSWNLSVKCQEGSHKSLHCDLITLLPQVFGNFSQISHWMTLKKVGILTAT